MPAEFLLCSTRRSGNGERVMRAEARIAPEGVGGRRRGGSGFVDFVFQPITDGSADHRVSSCMDRMVTARVHEEAVLRIRESHCTRRMPISGRLVTERSAQLRPKKR